MAIYSLPNSLFELSVRLPPPQRGSKSHFTNVVPSLTFPTGFFLESILVYHLPQLLEHGARVEPTVVSKWLLVLPGFAPAGEVLLFRQKDPKPWWPWRGPSGALRRLPTSVARKLAESTLSHVEGLKQCAPFSEIGCTTWPRHKATGA
jgi:hypothetical protein